MSWLLEREQHGLAWELLDENPDILGDMSSELIPPGTVQGGTEQLLDDESLADSAARGTQTAVEKEKQRIGELWIKELIDEGNWSEAG
ncbi:hypothetical protein NQ243_25870, partial [Escherichia coli]|nr:hypothetical protein [Escherichia coli]